MADTVSIALVGSLILTLTFVPVMCWYWFKKGVHERVNKPFNWVRRTYKGELEWCLNHPKITMLVATAIFAATLLLVPFIGGEFMPHLDEGALWIRATMPYTISFEEASRFSPQVRDILMRYPMVTDVGSELGRPDDGTDPTGFFNDEFYVGLKPYDDASWRTELDPQQEGTTEDIQKKAGVVSRRDFQLHATGRRCGGRGADRPEERARGQDLRSRSECAAEQSAGDQARSAQMPGFTELTVVRELGQPSLMIDVDRDKIARYGINVADVEAVVQAAVGGQAATQVIQGEKLFDLVVRMKPQFRENAQRDRQPAGRDAHRPADSAERAGEYSGSQRRFVYLSRKQFALYRRAVQRRRTRSAERGE